MVINFSGQRIMHRHLFLTIVAATGAMMAAAVGGCADLKSDLPVPVSPAGVVHPEGITNPSSPDWHGNLVREFNWDLRACQECHGTAYTGGTAGVSCITCHDNGGGPENCATCHGTVNPAPPDDLAGNTERTFPGVGAHQKHVAANDGLCVECHMTPVGGIFDPQHIDSTPGVGRSSGAG